MLIRGSERQQRYPTIANCLNEAEFKLKNSILELLKDFEHFPKSEFYIVRGGWILLKLVIDKGSVEYGSGDPDYGESMELSDRQPGSICEVKLLAVFSQSFTVALPVTSRGEHFGEIQLVQEL